MVYQSKRINYLIGYLLSQVNRYVSQNRALKNHHNHIVLRNWTNYDEIK